MPVQLRFASRLTSENYVSERGWLEAKLDHCPVHGSCACGFHRHSAYERVWPKGALIPRWYCPEAGMTFSLLPDFLAAGVKGSLAEISAVAGAVESGPSLEAVASALRPEVSLAAAVRWTRRRVIWFREGATVARGVLGELLDVPVLPSRLALALGAGVGSVLGILRVRMTPHLHVFARPVGLCPRCRVRKVAEGRNNKGCGQRPRGPSP